MTIRKLFEAGLASDLVLAAPEERVRTFRLRLTEGLIRLVSRAASMGLIQQQPDSLDEVLDALESHAVGVISVHRIRSAVPRGNLNAVATEVDRLVDLLDESPVPSTEWRGVGEVLGHEVVERLAAVSSSARRRYESGERTTPDDTSARLHFLAMVNADLLGSYNEFGVRRWYSRPRTALQGRSPSEVLVGDWSPSDSDPTKVRELAAALTAPSAS